MALAAAMLEGDLQFMLGDLADTFVWKSGTYACGRREKTDGQGFQDDAGIWPDCALELVAAVSAFSGALPAAGETVTYGGAAYRIRQTRRSEDGRALSLACEEA